MPTVEFAHTQLINALRDMAAWQGMLDDSKQYLHDMLNSRLSNTEMGTKYDLRYQACIKLDQMGSRSIDLTCLSQMPI